MEPGIPRLDENLPIKTGTLLLLGHMSLLSEGTDCVLGNIAVTALDI